MLPTRILLDLDDVCNRFTMYALKRVGCPVDELAYHDFDPEWGWDIVCAANALHPSRQFTANEFWDSIGRDVWASVPESAEFKTLLRRCEELVGTESVCILSSPTLDPDCLAGKLEWIHNHFPKRMHRQFLIGPRKHFCARPDALLIDDSDHNVDVFRAHGSQAILVPRPWNSLYYMPTNPGSGLTKPCVFDALDHVFQTKQAVRNSQPVVPATSTTTNRGRLQTISESETSHA